MDDITADMGRRALELLRELPGFKSQGEDVVSANGDKLRPFSDEDGTDHGTVNLKRAGQGKFEPFPVHHYLSEVIEHESGDVREAAEQALERLNSAA